MKRSDLVKKLAKKLGEISSDSNEVIIDTLLRFIEKQIKISYDKDSNTERLEALENYLRQYTIPDVLTTNIVPRVDYEQV